MLDRDDQIRALYDAALKRPAAERAAFVLASVAGDLDLQKRVQVLLARQQDTGLNSRSTGSEESGDVSPAIAAGTRVGNYRVDGRLGAGGMGVVYLATDTKLNRPAAIKVLPGNLADPDARRRFQREATLVSSLNHPHIVTVYDVGEYLERQYLITEFVDGGTLRHWAAFTRSWRQVVELLIGVADGIATAHDAGILHRDIKPENILLAKNGYAKLADFGLAKLVEGVETRDDGLSKVRHSLVGTVIGTVAYMSPEQASGLPLDQRSDVFSFGLVLYELLAGSRPFVADSEMDLMRQIVHAPVPALSTEIPADVRSIVDKALEKDPADRYQTMRDLVVDLRRFARRSAIESLVNGHEAANVPVDGSLARSERTQPTGLSARMQRVSGQKLSYVVTGLVVLAVSFLLGRDYAWDALPSAAVAPTTVTVSEPRAPANAVDSFAPPAHSVAVLPFVNMSGDVKDEYFSDGLAEELLNSLARIDELQVAARTSSFSFKNTANDIPTVARKLNVGAVLEGSVRKAGDRVRITAQLVDAVSGFHSWSRSYDGDLKDIFALQTEIATSVADALAVTLLGEAKPSVADGGTLNPQAFDAYLRGRKAKMSEGAESNRVALAAYDEAIALDPDYAMAYAERAQALLWLASVWTSDPNEIMRLAAEARAAAEKAIALAPTSGQAYAALGSVLGTTTVEFAAADAAFRRGLAVEPGNADLLLNYARYAPALGRTDALGVAERVVALNPLDYLAHVTRGIAFLYARRHDEARASFQEAQRLSDNVITRTWAGMNELAASQPAAAVSYSEPDRDSYVFGQVILAIAYFRLDRKNDATAMLQRIKAEHGDDPAYLYAAIYAQWGETAQALEWLETAVRAGDPSLWDIKVDPALDPLRGTPQFQEIVARLGFPP